MAALVFDSDDLELTEEFLSSSYAPMQIGSTTAKPETHITRVAVGTLSSDRLDFGFVMSYDVGPLQRICVCTLDSGTVEDHRVDGWRAAESFGPGEVFCFAPPDRSYTGRICRARYGITMFDPDLLAQVAAPVSGPVRLRHHRPVSDAAARHLRGVIAHVRDDVLADPEVAANPLVVSGASRYLAAAVLAAFPHSAGAREEGRVTPVSVRRAVAFIESRAPEDIGPADIAAAARVSARALQYSFRRHLGVTPMGYLRRTRLAGAHEDLRRADPDRGETVTGVAMRWGFYNQGRFTAAYRREYGRSPRETLHD